MHKKLKALWALLWTRVGAKGDGEEVFADLEARYGEPHRAYHTFDHIAWCLDELGEVRHLAKDADAVEFALWYHDAIYDTSRKDNEMRSALLAMQVIQRACLPRSLAIEASNLILATQHRNVPDSSDINANLVVDIDLASLGFPWEVFLANFNHIRREYAQFSDDEFRMGNSGFLHSFVDRPSIYGSAYFRERYESKARVNIQRLLALREASKK